jgi:hypothetical protein
MLFIHTVGSGPSRIGLTRGGGGIVLYLPTKLKFGDHLCTFSEVCVDGGSGGEEVKFS